MAKRRETLDRLRIGFECKASWSAMSGDGARRSCADCRREVFDFAQLTPREILAHLEASRGRLCARLTRQDGRLRVAQPPEPFRAAPAAARPRPALVAATLVGAWLGAAGAGETRAAAPVADLRSPRDEAGRESAPRHAAVPEPSAGLRGTVIAEDGTPLPGVSLVARNVLDGSQWPGVTRGDGSFRFVALTPGVYDLEGSLAGHAVSSARSIALHSGEEAQAELTASPHRELSTTGVLIATPQPLRTLFEDSELVVTAVAGRSTLLANDGGLVELATELRVESRLKGTAPARVIAYRHSAYVGESDVAEWRPEPAPGDRVLAFLVPADDAAGWRGRTFESVDPGHGVMVKGDAERAAYLERLDALVRMEQDSARRGAADPAELAEWLVATAEDPITRSEAMEELGAAAAAVRRLAERQGVGVDVAAADLRFVVDRFRADGGRLSREIRPEVVGAFLDELHRERLTAALVATRRLGDADLTLFSIVRAWAEPAARLWLARRLREDPEPGDADATWRLASLVEELGDPGLAEAVAEASRRLNEIYALRPGDDSAETARIREERLAPVRRDLRHRFADALAAGSASP